MNDFWVKAVGDNDCKTQQSNGFFFPHPIKLINFWDTNLTVVITLQNKQYRKKLVEDTKKSINQLISSFIEFSRPLTPSDTGLNEFCFLLESIIAHGLKGGWKGK